MAQITGKTEEKIEEELTGVIFKNPLTDQWENGDEYLSEAKKVTDRSDISSTVSRKIQNSAKTHGRRQKASYSFGPHEKYWKKRVSQKKKSAIFLPVIFWPRASPPLTASWNCRFL